MQVLWWHWFKEAKVHMFKSNTKNKLKKCLMKLLIKHTFVRIKKMGVYLF